MSRIVIGFLAVLAVAFAALTGLAVQRGLLGPPAEQTSPIGGPFRLIDQKGSPIDQTLLKGKWSAVFFGFTQCPEACPTTLFALGQAEKLLGAEAATFQTVLISVDPQRDTPAVLANYLSNDAFPKRVTGLTGNPEQIAGVTRAYRVVYEKAGDPASYTVNHTTLTYLMSPRGRFVCVLPYGATPQVMAGKINKAMKAGPRATSC